MGQKWTQNLNPVGQLNARANSYHWSFCYIGFVCFQSLYNKQGHWRSLGLQSDEMKPTNNSLRDRWTRKEIVRKCACFTLTLEEGKRVSSGSSFQQAGPAQRYYCWVWKTPRWEFSLKYSQVTGRNKCKYWRTSIWEIQISLSSDRGTNFSGTVIKELCKAIPLTQKVCYPYCPQFPRKVGKTTGILKQFSKALRDSQSSMV